ncbi:MAG: hypothetical protein Q4A52_02845, partial [Bacillota bacterium]|nr:hypothetical protein [Bacillota bacterium]
CNENPAQIRYMALEDENTLQICFDGNLQSFTTDNIKVQLKTGEELRDLKIVKAQEYPEIVWYLVQSPQAKMTGCIVTLQGLRSAKCGTELPVIEFEPPMTIN